MQAGGYWITDLRLRWLEAYRAHWERRFEKLDELLEEMKANDKKEKRHARRK